MTTNVDIRDVCKEKPFELSNVRQNFFRGLSAALNSPVLSFPAYLRQAWPIIEPGNTLIDSWYIGYICEHLELVGRGEIRKLLINMPPRYGKSNIVTILWPTWMWTLLPHMRFVFCSYSGSLSVKHSLARRRIIESDWYRENWGNVVMLQDDQNQKQEYENTARGHMIATSVGGTLTGKGGDVIVEDDMLKPDEADSEAMRYHMSSMHRNVLSSRLDNPKRGLRVVVEQRTHVDDLTGLIRKNESGWHELIVPLVAEKKTIIEFPISKRIVERQEGELLNQERHGQKEVDELKRTMGTRTFVAQAQQNPSSDMGNILKREWWKVWRVMPEGADISIQSWDMTFKKTEHGSFVVGQLWKKRGAHFFLIDQFRARVDFTGAVSAMLSFTGKYSESTAKLVEDAANGPAIISQLQNRIPGIVAISPKGSKLARAQAVSPFIESGNVHLPDPVMYPWVHDFIEECAAFKGDSGETNDQVDAMSQALSWLNELSSVAPVAPEFDWIEENEAAFAGGFHA